MLRSVSVPGKAVLPSAAPGEVGPASGPSNLPVEEVPGFGDGQGAVAHRRHRHRTLADLLRQLNPVLRGWCNYFRHGVSKRTFSYLDHFTWWRIFGWLRKRHAGLNKGNLARRFLPNWEVCDGQVEMFRPRAVPIVRYRYRGARTPKPWTSEAPGSVAPAG